MISQYIPILVGTLWAFFLAALLIGVSALFGPRRLTPEKTSIYECGVEPQIGDARSRFSVKFYVTAVIFLLFDIEVVFLYPWAVVFDDLPATLVFVEMIVFIAILFVGWLFMVKKGVLRWTKAE